MDSSGLVALWIVAGFVGALLLMAKGKLRLGFMTWVLFGWWGMLIAIALGGGLLLWWGVAAKPPRHCPHCRQTIHSDATRCPFCQSELATSVAAAS